MTTKGEWVAYTGSDEQIAKIFKAKNGWIARFESGYETHILGQHEQREYMGHFTHYWIIPDDPLREMKIRQAMTGQPVWIRRYSEFYDTYEYLDATTTPDWNIPNAEYSFSAFEE